MTKHRLNAERTLPPATTGPALETTSYAVPTR